MCQMCDEFDDDLEELARSFEARKKQEAAGAARAEHAAPVPIDGDSAEKHGTADTPVGALS